MDGCEKTTTYPVVYGKLTFPLISTEPLSLFVMMTQKLQGQNPWIAVHGYRYEYVNSFHRVDKVLCICGIIIYLSKFLRCQDVFGHSQTEFDLIQLLVMSAVKTHTEPAMRLVAALHLLKLLFV